MNRNTRSRNTTDSEDNPTQELRGVVSSTDETPSTFSTQNSSNNIPMSLRDLVTQTDANGNALSIAQPLTQDSSSRSRNDSLPMALETDTSVMDTPSSKVSLFRSIFCCVSTNQNNMVVDTKLGLRKKNDTAATATASTDMSSGTCSTNSSGRGGNSPLRINTTNQMTPSPGARPPSGRNNANSPTNGKISSRLNYETGASTPMRPEYINNSPMRPLTPQQKQIPKLLGVCSTKKPCLVLDLDETLVHSSFQRVPKCDFVIPVTIEGTVHNVYVIKRPGVDEFLERASKIYELIIYTASLSKYADPLLDTLDPKRLIDYRLFREHCVFHQGHYVKDLSLINRELNRTIIIDNSPMSYIFHPSHAIDCSSFIDDPRDLEMWHMMDFLEEIVDTKDVRAHCTQWKKWVQENLDISSVPEEMWKIQEPIRNTHNNGNNGNNGRIQQNINKNSKNSNRNRGVKYT